MMLGLFCLGRPGSVFDTGWDVFSVCRYAAGRREMCALPCRHDQRPSFWGWLPKTFVAGRPGPACINFPLERRSGMDCSSPSMLFLAGFADEAFDPFQNAELGKDTK
jgi:hypothetical protein